MCGILGIIKKKNINEHALVNALTAIKTRGPDASKYITQRLGSYNIGIGHNRLAIIDLSTNAIQPMVSMCGRYTLAFNGEIYNYIELRNELKASGVEFHTKSDTEVLLAAWMVWGVESLKHIRGMFAFAITDNAKCEIYLARDAFGIKPLYYFAKGDCFGFASEIKGLPALLEKNLLPNHSRIDEYIKSGLYDYGTETFYMDVHRLPAGHYIKLELGNLMSHHIYRWNNISIKKENRIISYDDASKLLREKFLQSVLIHARSDVPLGVALSGGLDSSTVACVLKYLGLAKNTTTFSYISNLKSQSEEAWVDRVTEFTGIDNVKISYNQQDFLADLNDFIRFQGEPVGTASIYAQYAVMKTSHINGIKVMLEGQGADEVVGGYYGYPSAMFRDLLDENKYTELIKYIFYVSRHPNIRSSQVIKSLAKAILPSIASLYKQSRGLAPDKDNISNSCMLQDEWEIPSRNLYREMRHILVGGGLECLLRHGDRNAMAFSIENRVPFLDIDFVNSMFKLPNYYHVTTKAETKSLFRHAMKGIVPDDVLYRRDKIGFESPESAMLKNICLTDLHVDTLNRLGLNKSNLKPDEYRSWFNNETDSRLKWRTLNLSIWASQTF